MYVCMHACTRATARNQTNIISSGERLEETANFSSRPLFYISRPPSSQSRVYVMCTPIRSRDVWWRITSGLFRVACIGVSRLVAPKVENILSSDKLSFDCYLQIQFKYPKKYNEQNTRVRHCSIVIISAYFAKIIWENKNISHFGSSVYVNMCLNLLKIILVQDCFSFVQIQMI